jgi:hypothetical protein
MLLLLSASFLPIYCNKKISVGNFSPKTEGTKTKAAIGADTVSWFSHKFGSLKI